MKQGGRFSIRNFFALFSLLFTLAAAPCPQAQSLLNINFGAYPSDVKTGPAAIGLAPDDFWNRYEAPLAAAAAVPNLFLADGAPSEIGLTVLNGLGHWRSTVDDPMYQTYVYSDLTDITVIVTNLPAKNYDIYIYGHAPDDTGNGAYTLTANETNYGTRQTLNGPGWDSLVWDENVQFVLYRDIPITNPDGSFTVTVSPGASGYRIINGMQIVPSGLIDPPPPGTNAPAFVLQPVSKIVAVGSDVTFKASATGQAPLSYQWTFRGTDIADATGTSYTLPGAQTNNAGAYAVTVSNASGSVTSSNAILTVAQVDNTTVGLINIDFGAYETDVKTGPAAAGYTANDCWNSYLAPYQNAASLNSLRLSDGTFSAACLTVLNGYGHWRSTVPDSMYQTYVYNEGAYITVTVTNITAGIYDIYIYGHGPVDDGNAYYTLSVNGAYYDTKSTLDGPGWDSLDWQEDVQYVRYKSVPLGPDKPLALDVAPGDSGYAIISGMQIFPATARLEMKKVGDQIILSWPASSVPWIVQEASQLSPDSWVDLPSDMIVSGLDTLTLTLPAPSESKFYRLKY